MKAVVFRATRDVVVEDVEDARIERDDDVVVRVTSSALCGTDLHMYEGRTGATPGMVLDFSPRVPVVHASPACPAPHTRVLGADPQHPRYSHDPIGLLGWHDREVRPGPGRPLQRDGGQASAARASAPRRRSMSVPKAFWLVSRSTGASSGVRRSNRDRRTEPLSAAAPGRLVARRQVSVTRPDLPARSRCPARLHHTSSLAGSVQPRASRSHPGQRAKTGLHTTAPVASSGIMRETPGSAGRGRSGLQAECAGLACRRG